MKHIFDIGAEKTMQKKVTTNDLAHFDAQKVHDVYATFALAKDVEWACRQFVLEMKEPHEEGIGTMLNIEHISPALLGEVVNFSCRISALKGNNVVCSYEVKVGDRLIAKGEQGQKILPKAKIDAIFKKLANSTT